MLETETVAPRSSDKGNKTKRVMTTAFKAELRYKMCMFFVAQPTTTKVIRTNNVRDQI